MESGPVDGDPNGNMQKKKKKNPLSSQTTDGIVKRMAMPGFMMNPPPFENLRTS